MRTSRIASLLAVCGVALAQAPPPAAIQIGIKEAPPTPAGGRIQTVVVGGFQPAATAGGQPTPQFAFTPESITAQPGETIRFMFLGNNHSVVQTSVDAPCQPAANGFNTGFKPNTMNDLTAAPMMDLPITATTPLYMSCLQVTHCGKGMVLTVNAPAEGDPGSHNLFKAAAIKIGNPGLQNAGIQAAAAVPQVMSTVQIRPQGVAAAASPTAGAPAPAGTVVMGTGKTPQGQACTPAGMCSCLCGGATGAMPADAGLGNFGGVVGSMPMPAAAAPMAAAPMAAAAISIRPARMMMERDTNHRSPLY